MHNFMKLDRGSSVTAELLCCNGISYLTHFCQRLGMEEPCGRKHKSLAAGPAGRRQAGRGLPVERICCQEGFGIRNGFARAVSGGAFEFQHVGMVKVCVCDNFF